MNITVRLFVNGKKICEETQFVSDADLEMEYLGEEFMRKHAMRFADEPHMIEIEFLDEADVNTRFARFGTDPRQMVRPVAVEFDQA